MHGIVKPIWCLQTSPRIRQFHQDAIFFLTADTENAKKLKKKEKKLKILYTSRSAKMQAECMSGNYLQWLKLKYQLGSQPKLGHKRNASKSAQEMSRGPAEQSQLSCCCSLPSRRSSRERKALGRE